MPNWKYKLNEHQLELVDNPSALWNKTDDGQDNSYLNGLIDAKVHELTALIQKCDNEIYRLRKYQKVLNKGEEFNGPE